MAVRDEFGTQAIWGDSFQNMYMSQLSWGDGSGAPQQRLWWEKLAQWSQAGILFMSESYAFPGLSCSIEVPDWEQDIWYFQYVWKWHRGTAQQHIAPERLDELCFRAMANRGWTAPDGSPKVIPSFGIFAQSYNLALPACSARTSCLITRACCGLMMPVGAVVCCLVLRRLRCLQELPLNISWMVSQ